jgi:hypothetical protein
MGSHIVVIGRIVFQNSAQMSLTGNNDVVQTLAPDRSYQPFGKAILPRRGRCNRPVPNANGSQPARGDNAANSISISDHVTRSTVPRKSLGDPACDPLRRRVGCDVDPDEISAINPYNHEAVQQFEANGRDHEQQTRIWTSLRLEPIKIISLKSLVFSNSCMLFARNTQAAKIAHPVTSLAPQPADRQPVASGVQATRRPPTARSC